jgi:NAD+--dinitrogen-reductase ADP-D-ribosyltransferase
MRAKGLYGTNALESQLDLVYTYSQYEFKRSYPHIRHLTLYRGVNRVGDHDRLGTSDKGNPILLLNNLSSFSCSRERAGEFGDYILSVQIPCTKILFYCNLIPGILKGEDEFMVIGGAYEVEWSTD